MVRDAPIDRGQACGRLVSQPRHLYRSRLSSEYGQAIVCRVPRKIHQDIYLLILNITEQLFIIPVPAIHPTICVRPQPLRVFIIDTIGIIAVDFKAVMVVILY